MGKWKEKRREKEEKIVLEEAKYIESTYISISKNTHKFHITETHNIVCRWTDSHEIH